MGWIVTECGFSAAALTNRLLGQAGSERTVPASSFMAYFLQMDRIAQVIRNPDPLPFRMLTADPTGDIATVLAPGWHRLDHWVEAVIVQIAFNIAPVVLHVVGVTDTVPDPGALFQVLSEEFVRANPWIRNSLACAGVMP